MGKWPVNEFYVFEGGAEKEGLLEWSIYGGRGKLYKRNLTILLLPTSLLSSPLFCRPSAVTTALSGPRRRSYNPVEDIADSVLWRAW